jgi:hypothetical protein
VLLLPEMLDRLRARQHVDALLRAPDALAVEPARVSYGALARLPAGTARAVARRQALRMELPGVPAVVVILHPLQFPLAAALLAFNPGAELWYAPPEQPPEGSRQAALHAAAAEHAAETIALPISAPLWTRMESLGVESGRLGSERLG